MAKSLGYGLRHSEKLLLNTGVYIVRITTQSGLHTLKILIK